MNDTRFFFKGILLCIVVLVAHALALERAKAAGNVEANKPVSPLSVFPSADSFALFSTTEHHEEDHVRGDRQQEPEQTIQPDTTPDDFNKKVTSSCGASTSFAEQSASADEDVSCFPHDQNIGCRSNTVKQVHSNTVQDCLRECRKVDYCTHYTYNKNSKVCHLKNAVPDFYTYNGDMTGPRSCDSSCFVSCLTYNTNPIRTLNYKNTAPSLCQAACAATKDCQAFVRTESDCRLFGSGFGAHRSVDSGNSLAGPRFLCEVGSDLRLREAHDGTYLGTCLISDSVGSKAQELGRSTEAPNVLACQQRCASENSCTHYTYNADSRVCFIKSGEPHYYRYPNDVTGAKNCVPT